MKTEKQFLESFKSTIQNACGIDAIEFWAEMVELIDERLEAIKVAATNNRTALFPIDRQRLISIISDIKQGWTSEGVEEMEYSAIEYGIEKFYEWILKQLA